MSFETVTIGPCTLIRGDCVEVLPTLDGIDCIISDPPYGIAHGCNFRTRGRSVLAECNEYPDVIGDSEPFDPYPILDIGVPTVLWGANHYAELLPSAGGWLVWDKLRPDELDQATCELAWTNCVKGVRRFSHLWHGMMRHSERGENYHPMQKPVALARWILSLRWIPDGKVCDPYMGAGWVALACMEAGREFVGIEIADYFDTACERLERMWRQPKLALEAQPVMVQRELITA